MPFEAFRRGHIGWTRRRAGDNKADTAALRFIERLDGAVLDFDRGRHRFEGAARKADHVDELRRVLGVLLDVLADWEQLAERAS